MCAWLGYFTGYSGRPDALVFAFQVSVRNDQRQLHSNKQTNKQTHERGVANRFETSSAALSVASPLLCAHAELSMLHQRAWHCARCAGMRRDAARRILQCTRAATVPVCPSASSGALIAVALANMLHEARRVSSVASTYSRCAAIMWRVPSRSLMQRIYVAAANAMCCRVAGDRLHAVAVDGALVEDRSDALAQIAEDLQQSERRCRACAGPAPEPGQRRFPASAGAGPVPFRCRASARSAPVPCQCHASAGPVPCRCRASSGACWCSVGSCLNAKCCKILPPASSCGSCSRAHRKCGMDSMRRAAGFPLTAGPAEAGSHLVSSRDQPGQVSRTDHRRTALAQH